MNKTQKNILIGGLLGLVLIMAIGYAAFATNLNIGGTAETTSTWNIRITNIRTVNLASINGVAIANNGAYDVTAPTYDNTNGLTATFSTGLTSPGDTRVYEVEVSNLGSINADITKTLTNNSNNPAIEFTYDGVSSTSVLTSAGAYTKSSLSTTEPFSLPANTNNVKYVYVTVKYSDSVQGQPASTTGSMTLTLNAVQEGNSSSGGGSTDQPFTGTIYRNNENEVAIGDSIARTQRVWCIIGTLNGEAYNSCTDGNWGFDTDAECEAEINDAISDGDIQEGDMTCSQGTITTEGVDLGEYTTNAATLNKTYYLKHEVVDNIITESYVCFVTDTEHCMRGGDSSYYAANKTLLQGQESWFNNHSGSCSFGDSSSACFGGGFRFVHAFSNGLVDASVSDSDGCGVFSYGGSSCGVSESGGGSGSGEDDPK